jgi:hypothetical protein
MGCASGHLESDVLVLQLGPRHFRTLVLAA